MKKLAKVLMTLLIIFSFSLGAMAEKNLNFMGCVMQETESWSAPVIHYFKSKIIIHYAQSYVKEKYMQESKLVAESGLMKIPKQFWQTRDKGP